MRRDVEILGPVDGATSLRVQRMYVSPDQYRVRKLRSVYVTETPEGEVCGLWNPWPTALDATRLRLIMKGLHEEERGRIPEALRKALVQGDYRILGQVKHEDQTGDVIIAGTDEPRLSPLQAKLMEGGGLVVEDAPQIQPLLFAGGPVATKLWTALERASDAVCAESELARVASRKLVLPEDLRLMVGWLTAPEYRYRKSLMRHVFTVIKECAARRELVDDVLEIMGTRNGARLQTEQVAAILAPTGAPRAIPLLLRRPVRSSFDAVVRIGGPEAVEALSRYLIERGIYDGECWEALGKLGAEAGERILEHYRGNRSFRLSADTARLAKLCGNSARSDLLAALVDPHRRIRANAVPGLIALEDDSVVTEALQLLADGPAHAHPEILRLFVGAKDSSVIPDLVAHLDRARPPLLWSLIDALVDLDDAEALAALEQRIDEGGRAMKLRVARALECQNSDESRRLLVELLGDEESTVRVAAVESLSRLVELHNARHEEALLALLERIIDPAPEVARAVARVLPRIGSIRSLVEELQTFGAKGWQVSDRVVESIRSQNDRQKTKSTAESNESPQLSSPSMELLLDTSGSMKSLPHKGSSAAGYCPLPGDSFLPAPLKRGEGVDPVHFTVNAPSELLPGSRPLIDVWAHLSSERAAVLEQLQRSFGEEVSTHSRGPVSVQRGSVLEVDLTVRDLYISTPREPLEWTGSAGNCQFPIEIPEDASPGDHLGTISVHFTGVLLTKVHFILHIGTAEGAEADVTAWEDRPQSVFASYSSKDRTKVLGRIQGMQKILPELDVFLDVASLRSGDDWKARIATEIESRDRLYLFWSRAAKASPWVDFEWRHALEAKGRRAIDPVPLERPEVAAPPTELEGLHFGDWILGFTEEGARDEDGEAAGPGESEIRAPRSGRRGEENRESVGRRRDAYDGPAGTPALPAGAPRP